MMRSLSSAVAGLRSHQTKMDVIGNNIANVNTYGYKASRTTFADVYYQNLSRGSGPVTTLGGTNPTQIGYGAAVATIDVQNTVAGASQTDRPMDVYITGEGYLVTQDQMGNLLYTRLGALGFDANGNLVDGGGKFVMGFPQRADGTPIISADGTVLGDELQTIRVSTDLLDQLTDISISSGGEIIGLLPGGTRITLGSAVPEWLDVPTVPEDSNLQGPITLSVGALPDLADLNATVGGSFDRIEFGEYSITSGSAMEITMTPGGIMTMKVTVQPNDPTEKPTTITAEGTYENGKLVLRYENKVLMTMYDDDPTDGSFNAIAAATPAIGSAAAVPGTTVDSAGLMYQVTTRDKGGNVRSTGVIGPDGKLAAGPLALTSANFKAETITDPSGATTTRYYAELGDARIYFTDLSKVTNFVGEMGKIGMFDSEKLNIGCIAIAKFANSAGLQQVGNTQYMTTENTGDVTYNKPDTNGVGGLKANYLEMSNVDISKEFTDMITTQRGFQANTRIVTVSDEMLNELVNLKR